MTASSGLAGTEGAVVWSTHALQRLIAHRLVRPEVQKALATSEVIEDYPEGHRTLPDCLVLGFEQSGQPANRFMLLSRSIAISFAY